MTIIETENLILRTWETSDEDAFYQINQDPKVFEFLGGPLSKQEVKDFITAMNDEFAARAYTLFATEEKTTKNLIGSVGLHTPTWEAHFTPCVEIGWRLGSQYWNKGYATEAARAVLAYARDKLKLTEILSFTVPQNFRSIRIMEKIGMHYDPTGDFAHPKLPLSHPLSKHVLYRLKLN